MTAVSAANPFANSTKCKSFNHIKQLCPIIQIISTFLLQMFQEVVFLRQHIE